MKTANDLLASIGKNIGGDFSTHIEKQIKAPIENAAGEIKKQVKEIQQSVSSLSASSSQPQIVDVQKIKEQRDAVGN